MTLSITVLVTLHHIIYISNVYAYATIIGKSFPHKNVISINMDMNRTAIAECSNHAEMHEHKASNALFICSLLVNL